MRRRIILVLTVFAMAVLLCGCENTSIAEVPKVKEVGLEEFPVNSAAPEDSKSRISLTESDEVFAENTKVMPEETEPEAEEALDTEVAVPAENEDAVENKAVDKVENPENIVSEEDEIPADTLPPDKTEDLISDKEKEPTFYLDRLGNMRFELIDGIWYEYAYSTGYVTLYSNNLSRAHMFLEMDGSYDGYDVYKEECVKMLDDHGKTAYKFSITYYKKDPVSNMLHTAVLSEEDIVIGTADMVKPDLSAVSYSFFDATLPEKEEVPAEEEKPEADKDEKEEIQESPSVQGDGSAVMEESSDSKSEADENEDEDQDGIISEDGSKKETVEEDTDVEKSEKEDLK